MKKDDKLSAGEIILGIILLILLLTGKLIIGLAFAFVTIAVVSVGITFISWLIDLYKKNNIAKRVIKGLAIISIPICIIIVFIIVDKYNESLCAKEGCINQKNEYSEYCDEHDEIDYSGRNYSYYNYNDYYTPSPSPSTTPYATKRPSSNYYNTYPNNPSNYSDYEDFYYDNEEDFDDIDDAESYYEENGGDY